MKLLTFIIIAIAMMGLVLVAGADREGTPSKMIAKEAPNAVQDLNNVAFESLEKISGSKDHIGAYEAWVMPAYGRGNSERVTAVQNKTELVGVPADLTAFKDTIPEIPFSVGNLPGNNTTFVKINSTNGIELEFI